MKIQQWLDTDNANIILTHFATRRNLSTTDKPALIKAYLTFKLIEDARIINNADPDDSNDTDSIIDIILPSYKKVLAYFNANNWDVPDKAICKYTYIHLPSLE